MDASNLDLPPLPPPPGAVTALINGFNAIAGNVAVILFPVVLDLFFWLGPRLKMDTLLSPFMDLLLPQIRALPPSQAPADQVRIVIQGLTDFYNGANLFSVFRTFPLGVFSLMSVNISVNSPLGVRMALDVPNPLAIFGLVLVLTFLGWLGGGLYFRAVSRVALNLKEGPGVFRSLLHGVLLSGAWMMCLFMSLLPIMIALWWLGTQNAFWRTFLLMLLAIPASWAVLAIFFSFHGIFVNAQNAFTSTRSSLRLLRYGLPPLGWFTMLTLLISQAMNLLWRVAPADSWMMGIGILGHAFVSTSLLAASFIYYRDLNTWIESALQWLKKQNPSSARA